MRLQYILMMVFIFICTIINGQVGININRNIQGVLHIDSNSDSDFSVIPPIHTEDDVVIDASGNLGLGEVLPTHKLEINGNTIVNGNLTINDNTQQEGYVLRSDDGGNTRWDIFSPVTIIDITANTPVTYTEGTQVIFPDNNITIKFSENADFMGIRQYQGTMLESTAAIIVPEGQYHIMIDLDLIGDDSIHPIGIFNIAYRRKPDNNSNIEWSQVYPSRDLFFVEKAGGMSFAMSFSSGIENFNAPHVWTFTFTPTDDSYFGTSNNRGYFATAPYTGTPRLRITLMKYQPVGLPLNP